MSQLETVLSSDFKPTAFDRSIDGETIAIAESMISDVRTAGRAAVRRYAVKFGERTAEQPLVIDSEQMQAAKQRIPVDQLALLERVADRIRKFATAQLNCLTPLTLDVPGGQAGHTIEPIERVGCYAPAGRFPLPSTALMTAVTARVAGCRQITLAVPNPDDLMLAAAAVAGADQVLAVGGAHAIASLAYGLDGLPACDLIVGPGSRWVTAAKRIVSGDVGIDMLAGPSELVIIADESSKPARLAADLLAQAEHDTDARVFLITNHQPLIEAVNRELEQQLNVLPTTETARVAIQGGAAILVDAIEGAGTDGTDSNSAIGIANQLAPEHLELHCQNAAKVATKIRHAGCLFIGHDSAEVFGDYGAGPNHTLPTAGTARWSAGLNVFTFIRLRTWLQLEQAPTELIDDTCRLAELEGLIAHQRAAKLRYR